MRAKINCLFLLCCVTCGGASAQRILIDSIQRKLATARNDSTRWYYSLELAAKYIAINADSARIYGEASLAFSDQLGPGVYKASSTNTLGATYWRKGDYDTALKYYFEAARLADAGGFGKLHSTALANIGLIYSERKDTARAFNYLHKSLTIKYSLHDTLGIMRGLNNLGEAFLTAGKPDSALTYFQRCVPWFKYRPDQIFGKGIVLNNIGSILLERHELDSARYYLEQSRQLREQIGDQGGLSSVLSNLGQLELAEGRPAQAILYLNKSLSLSQETGSSNDQAITLKNLADAHAAQNQFSQAYHYLDRYVALQDTLHRQASEQRIAEMEVKYQTGLKEAEITRQQLQIERQQSRQRLLLAGTLAVVLSLLALFQYFRNRHRLRQKETRYALALEQTAATQLRELDRTKSAFFANISHEFRTPLTLILGPVQKWLNDLPAIAAGEGRSVPNLPTPVEDRFTRPQSPAELPVPVPTKDLHLIRRNANRLLELVNQLLDLSRLESGRLKLHLTEGDLVQALRVIAHTYESMAEQAAIQYFIQIKDGPLPGWFDRDKLEKIVGNLLSNAFKNTPAGGTVTLQADVRDAQLQLSVTDTGRGIPAEERDKIFERFYQVDISRNEAEGNREMSGSGIGLALVKELVILHHGFIQVENAATAGAVFRLQIPTDRAAFRTDELAEIATGTGADFLGKMPVSQLENPVPTQNPPDNPSLPLCLVVEDNLELQGFIRDELAGQFRVLLAPNGRAGLTAATEHIPDLIISDVMMPIMDGHELCTALKTDERTSHIPVILLTARAGQVSKLQGLETGADDYLTKPFDTRELLVRAQNLVQQRERLRRQFSRTVVLQPKEVALTSADERFVQRIQETLDIQLGNEQFSVEDLAASAGMSRSQLHRKLTALIDQPPVEFIRNFRLRRAKEMLEAGVGNVSEVCYAVGFASPAYFSKAFKEAFGMAPSAVGR